MKDFGVFFENKKPGVLVVPAIPYNGRKGDVKDFEMPSALTMEANILWHSLDSTWKDSIRNSSE